MVLSYTDTTQHIFNETKPANYTHSFIKQYNVNIFLKILDGVEEGGRGGGGGGGLVGRVETVGQGGC